MVGHLCRVRLTLPQGLLLMPVAGLLHKSMTSAVHVPACISCQQGSALPLAALRLPIPSYAPCCPARPCSGAVYAADEDLAEQLANLPGPATFRQDTSEFPWILIRGAEAACACTFLVHVLAVGVVGLAWAQCWDAIRAAVAQPL